MAHFTVTVTMDSSADALLEPTPALPPSAGLRTGRSNQLAERYALRIQQGLAAPGSRLPSVRECARRHGVRPCWMRSA